jgi:hypothetical protein
MARPTDLRQRSHTLAEALAALENGLKRWFDEQEIDIDKGERP